MGRKKLSEYETNRQIEFRKQLRLGLLLVFHTADYHDDDITPPGFLKVNDFAIIVQNHEKGPVYAKGTRDIAYYYTKWKIITHWGVKEVDEFYLGAMTQIVE